MELYIARHGETEANVKKLWQGQGLDTPLTVKGIEQAKNLGKFLENIEFDAIYSSNQKRAMDTTCIAFNDPDIFSNRGILDKRLAEISLGNSEGFSYANMNLAQTKIFNALLNDPASYIAPPSGEAILDVLDRVDSFLEEIAQKPYRNVFALTHAYVLRVVYACVMDKKVSTVGQAPIVDNCTVCRYTYNNGKWGVTGY